MTATDPEASGRIFISYRRQDTAYPAGWLYDRLTRHFGEGHLFKDVDSIEMGDDFVDAITRAVGSCDVLLALIGDQWLSMTDDEGRRRLDQPDDFVRLEIEAALAREVRVIPILVDGASMPEAEELPPSLAKLARRHAMELSPARFESDTERLLTVLERTVTPLPPPAAKAPTPSATVAPPPGHLAGAAGAPAGRPLLTGPRALIGTGVLAIIMLLVGVAAMSGGDVVIFGDDFSVQGAGWRAEGTGEGRYTGGAYHLRADAVDEGGAVEAAPAKARDVYPTAPSDVRLEVGARLVARTGQDAGYGLACRLQPTSAYSFLIWVDRVAIGKYTDADPFYVDLANGPVTIDPAAQNRLQASCTGDADSQHLVFRVNDVVVAEVIDTRDPFSGGSAGLLVGNGGGSTLEAAFDDFAVAEV